MNCLHPSLFMHVLLMKGSWTAIFLYLLLLLALLFLLLLLFLFLLLNSQNQDCICGCNQKMHTDKNHKLISLNHGIKKLNKTARTTTKILTVWKKNQTNQNKANKTKQYEWWVSYTSTNRYNKYTSREWKEWRNLVTYHKQYSGTTLWSIHISYLKGLINETPIPCKAVMTALGDSSMHKTWNMLINKLSQYFYSSSLK